MTNLWVTPEELDEDLADSEYAYEACKTASYLLWALSGRKFSGTTQVTEVYELPPFSQPDRLTILNRAKIAQETLSDMIRVPSSKDLRLKNGPVQGIDLIKTTTGLFVSSNDYVVRNHGLVTFSRPVTTPLEITYTYGQQPPTAGRMAARELAKQFTLAWSGEDCELPSRVTSINRQGVSMTILDQQDFVADLRTGVYAVDLFLKTVNPMKALRKSRVYSPDIPRGVRKTSRPLQFPAGPFDLVAGKNHGGVEALIPFEDLGLPNEVPAGESWTFSVELHNWNDTQQKNKTVVTDDGKLVVSLTYAEVFDVIGSDPGYYTVYLKKNDTITPTLTANLSAKLYSATYTVE